MRLRWYNEIEKGGIYRMNSAEKTVIKIEQLKFDKLNPRLPKILLGISDEKVIIDYMLKNGNILELMRSIAEMGYSEAEPLLVVKDEKDNKYLVVEGNRRLTAVKLLNNPQLAKVRIPSVTEIVSEANTIPDAIPAILYSSRESILDYLGYRHITGVKEWGALEKAKYLDQLYQTHCTAENRSDIYTKLAKMIGSRSDYVRKLHQAFKLYNIANEQAYYGADISEEQISFSWLTTAIGYNEIAHFINITDDMKQINQDNFEKVFLWLFDPQKKVIAESREISRLAKIIAQDKSLKKLENGSSIEEAILYTSHPSEAFIEMLKEARKSLRQAKDAIEQLSEEPSGARDILEETAKIIKTIVGGLDSNFLKEKIEISESISKENFEKFVEAYMKLKE